MVAFVNWDLDIENRGDRFPPFPEDGEVGGAGRGLSLRRWKVNGRGLWVAGGIFVPPSFPYLFHFISLWVFPWDG